MIRVLSVFGTRPEAIKMAPVIAALVARPDVFESRICVTAQHREMLDQVLAAFALTPDDDLDVMTPGQTPGGVVSRILDRLPVLLQAFRPTVLLVQGDTMTTFAAALAAFLERIPTAHVEAGLRSHDRWRPFPEEMNRVLTSQLAALHFAPTPGARIDLLREGIPEESIVVTGNTIVDALQRTVRSDYRFRHPTLAALDAQRRLILVTTHRRENFGAPLEATCGALRDLGERFRDLEFVLPVHPNPRVKSTVERLLRGMPDLHLIEPVDYLEFVHLMARATLILTDSGGVQEEAPSLGKPVLVLRDVTERPEGVAAGVAALVGTNRARIVETASALLADRARYDGMARAANPYGDGRAGERIAEILAARFG